METSARNIEIVDGTIAALSNPADRLGVYNRMRLTQLPALQPGLEGDTARVPPRSGNQHLSESPRGRGNWLDSVFHADGDRFTETFERPVLVVTNLHGESIFPAFQLKFHTIGTVTEMHPRISRRNDLAGR